MKKSTMILCAVLLLIGVAGVVEATPMLNPNNGHYYESVYYGTIWWPQANALGSSSYYMGMQGHLATITSSAEND